MRPAKKYSQAARLHDVIRLIEARHGVSVEEIAAECEITRRTVYRDLGAIRDAGYPLVADRDTDGCVLYRFLSGFSRIPPITFSLEELMTLYLCRGQLAFLQGTPFQDDLDAIFGRIRASLPPRSIAHLERIAETAVPRLHGARDYRGKRQILADLRRALLFQFRCRIRYAPARRAAEDYLFDPYTLLFFRDSLYLGGYAHSRNDLRLFLVDRIAGVSVLNERFEVPDDFRPEALTGGAFGLIDGAPLPVRARFCPEVAHLIRERSWHPSQSLEELPDGSVILAFTAAGERELLSWLFSFLPHVEVLEPPALRDSFTAALQQAARSCPPAT